MVDEWGYVAPASCYWCGAAGDAVDELYHAEGARLAGSPPLPLPPRLSERERFLFVLCLDCVRLFAELRVRHEEEIFEAGRA